MGKNDPISILADVAGPVVMLAVYHDMVEALLHPHNTDAIRGVREVVATARFSRAEHGHEPKNPIIAQLIVDAEAVLASLGVEPLEWSDVEPMVDAAAADVMDAVERFISERIAEHHFSNLPSSGRVN